MISQKAYDAIKEFFNGDGKKATQWFLTPNPLLGQVRPIDMIRMGREKKLEKFIFQKLEENRR